MSILLRIVAVVAVLIAAFLVGAVINALASDGGARTGVAIAYIAAAIVLTFGAVMAWRRAGRRPSAPGAV